MKDYTTYDGRIKRKWICMNFECPVVVMFVQPKLEEDAVVMPCPVCGKSMLKETFSGELPTYVEGKTSHEDDS